MNQVAKLDIAQIRQQAINDGLLVIGKGVFGADGKHSVEDFLFMFL